MKTSFSSTLNFFTTVLSLCNSRDSCALNSSNTENTATFGGSLLLPMRLVDTNNK